ncbi:MAG: metalloregulator ArsR/SmtB family transcription factor [Lachnospiraceae bacterium]|nr:metalloregulator ArsR/SmtB family transcription factor [Lachnospiraceae bacterium]
MEVVEIIHIITDARRFHLIQLLLEHHYCVKALAKKLGISEPAVSQHLRILKQYQLVEGVKIGYQTHYQINREKIYSLLNELSKQIAQYPLDTPITKDWDCSCEYISDCIKRDSKLLEEQGYGE